MTDFANVAAATAAGYKYITWAGNDGALPVVYSSFTKELRGAETGEDDDNFTVSVSDATQALADAKAVSALNAQRSQRYGFGEPASPDIDNQADAAPEVVDAT